MTIRLIIRRDDAAMAANVGGAVLTSYRTFEIEHPEIEAILRGVVKGDHGLCHAQIVGAEVVDPVVASSPQNQEPSQ